MIRELEDIVTHDSKVDASGYRSRRHLLVLVELDEVEAYLLLLTWLYWEVGYGLVVIWKREGCKNKVKINNNKNNKKRNNKETQYNNKVNNTNATVDNNNNNNTTKVNNTKVIKDNKNNVTDDNQSSAEMTLLFRRKTEVPRNLFGGNILRLAESGRRKNFSNGGRRNINKKPKY